MSVTSELANQCTQKVLFTSLVYSNVFHSLDLGFHFEWELDVGRVTMLKLHFFCSQYNSIFNLSFDGIRTSPWFIF